MLNEFEEKLHSFGQALNILIDKSAADYPDGLKKADDVFMVFYGEGYKLAQFTELITALDKHAIWGRCGRLSDHFTSRELLNRLIKLSLDDALLHMDCTKALEILADVSDKLNANVLQCKFHVQLPGVNISDREFQINDSVKLVSLTPEDQEARRLFCNSFETMRKISSEDCQTEIQLLIQVPLLGDKVDVDQAFFDASNKARETCEQLLLALHLTFTGRFKLGVRTFDHFLLNGTVTYKSIYNTVSLTETTKTIDNVGSLQKNFNYVCTEFGRDKVLTVAMRRFMLGQQRYSTEDRIIDYVIAWEAILLTINNSSSKTELSYRFGLNGSSVLAVCSLISERSEGLKMMRDLYNIRSTIVHGGDVNGDELIRTVINAEQWLRVVILWLCSIPKNERPYCKAGGWETLLWN